VKRAADIAKDVRKFWSKCHTVVHYAIRERVAERRRALLDKELNVFVGQSEQFSRLLAARKDGPSNVSGSREASTELGGDGGGVVQPTGKGLHGHGGGVAPSTGKGLHGDGRGVSPPAGKGPHGAEAKRDVATGPGRACGQGRAENHLHHSDEAVEDVGGKRGGKQTEGEQMGGATRQRGELAAWRNEALADTTDKVFEKVLEEGAKAPSNVRSGGEGGVVSMGCDESDEEEADGECQAEGMESGSDDEWRASFESGGGLGGEGGRDEEETLAAEEAQAMADGTTRPGEAEASAVFRFSSCLFFFFGSLFCCTPYKTSELHS
jgi:hypothetical protein